MDFVEEVLEGDVDRVGERQPSHCVRIPQMKTISRGG